MKADLKTLAKVLGVKELRMAQPVDMNSILHVEKGCVTAMTPFMVCVCVLCYTILAGLFTKCTSLLLVFISLQDGEGLCQSVLDSALFQQNAPLRMCAGCSDARDHTQHNISSCPPSALQSLLLESNHTPILIDFEASPVKKVDLDSVV